MGRRPGRSSNGPQGDDGGAWSALPDLQVELLRQRFVRFRRDHRPGTRYPEALREAVLAALRNGAAEPELRRLCRLSAGQLAAWRRAELTAALPRAVERPLARVFSVVDASHPEVSGARALTPACEDLELRVGGWAVRIRRVDD